MVKRLFLFIFLFLSCQAFGQKQACPESENKKSVKSYKDAESVFKTKKDYDKALDLAQTAIDADPENSWAYLLASQIAQKKKDYKTMEEMLSKSLELCEYVDADAYFQLGWLQYDLKKYKESVKSLRKFFDFGKVSEDHARKADSMIVRADLLAHPVPFEPQPLPGVSTPAPEYLPYISPDNDWIYFTRRFDMAQKGLFTSVSVEKFMFSQRRNGTFDNGKPLDWPFNKENITNEGGASITLDNKHLYFTQNNNGNYDICVTHWINGSWDEIINLGPNVNDPKKWDSQPSVTQDGNTLYFASNRDSLTGTDIYVTHKDSLGNWGKAQKLPSPINTAGNDKTPFIHPDGKTLYFSSDGRIDLGGYDIFMSKMDSLGQWGPPVNLGSPINTDADEVGFFASTDGKTGYFASNKISGHGYDIYYFPLYPKVRPERVYVQKGILKADNSTEPVSATIEIRNTVTNQMTKITVDSVTGEYAFVVDFKNDLLVTANKDGYAFNSNYISASDTVHTDPVKKDITIQKIEVGKQYTINDIRFATNSYDINDTIKNVLDAFIAYLKANPKLHVALQGHTDNIGSEQDNLLLSESRAKTIYSFLVDKGVQRSRLSYKGYGATMPIASNDSEEGRALNRRTVFVVTAK
jgi:outer membrane protein OmpA-like peptidoglycan-associated protein/tetratricopeptide (TPR) repeat protein